MQVALGHAEAGHVETAAVIEVELLVLLDDRVGVGRGPEARTGREHAADRPGFRRQRDVGRHLFFVGDGGDAFRRANAEIDHAVRRQLESWRAAR